ncbi:CLUMA_CG019201, isoform A [Clunio marinus]|uniref:CLUMA_CG019201, isoform A n=1 Tax=Clunio marinus TaxID=568069 RepID=A0A1J1J1Q5_9DIPT|nr:CLUMA_CG019201, isoform A [Clunio marinus]
MISELNIKAFHCSTHSTIHGYLAQKTKQVSKDHRSHVIILNENHVMQNENCRINRSLTLMFTAQASYTVNKVAQYWMNSKPISKRIPKYEAKEFCYQTPRYIAQYVWISLRNKSTEILSIFFKAERA